MFGAAATAPTAPRDYAACSGCSLCLLVCPMWRGRRDPRFSPEGLAKALQCGASAAELAAALDACSLCGACDPVCPEGIDLSGLVIGLRRQLRSESAAGPRPAQKVGASGTAAAGVSRAAALLLPGPELRADAGMLSRVQALLGASVAEDDGDDIALALETGADITDARLGQFLGRLRGRTVVAADGLLLRQLRRWLPGSQRMGLGPALVSRAVLRAKLGASDLYVIEPRAYHADHERMVGYYDRLQAETGCRLNLDLQRIAIPSSAAGGDDTQIRWILRGRQPARIVVESLADLAAYQRGCDLPVVYLADLAENYPMKRERPHANR